MVNQCTLMVREQCFIIKIKIDTMLALAMKIAVIAFSQASQILITLKPQRSVAMMEDMDRAKNGPIRTLQSGVTTTVSVVLATQG